jgi:membrane protein YqaA with SNARE-associated domain
MMRLPFLHSLYDRVLKASAHPKAMPMLAFICFTESFIFPIPQDVMMVPMMLAARKKAFFIATIALMSSVLGGIVGYYIGFYLFQTVALPIIEFYNYQESYQKILTLYQEHGTLIVLIGSLTPLPYKVVTISSGFVQLSLLPFIAMSVLGRAIRFYLLALLFWYFGDAIKIYLKKFLPIMTILICAVLILLII